MLNSFTKKLFTNIPEAIKEISEDISKKLNSVKNLDKTYLENCDDDSLNLAKMLESNDNNQIIEALKFLLAV